MFIRAARSYHYFIISKKVIVHGGMAHEVKLRAGACVKNELETRFVIISLMSSGYLSSDAYCPIVTVIYIYTYILCSHNLSPRSRFRETISRPFLASTQQFVVRHSGLKTPRPRFFSFLFSPSLLLNVSLRDISLNNPDRITRKPISSSALTLFVLRAVNTFDKSIRIFVLLGGFCEFWDINRFD